MSSQLANGPLSLDGRQWQRMQAYALTRKILAQLPTVWSGQFFHLAVSFWLKAAIGLLLASQHPAKILTRGAFVRIFRVLFIALEPPGKKSVF
jgi:hypothetical protein